MLNYDELLVKKRNSKYLELPWNFSFDFSNDFHFLSVPKSEKISRVPTSAKKRKASRMSSAVGTVPAKKKRETFTAKQLVEKPPKKPTLRSAKKDLPTKKGRKWFSSFFSLFSFYSISSFGPQSQADKKAFCRSHTDLIKETEAAASYRRLVQRARERSRKSDEDSSSQTLHFAISTEYHIRFPACRTRLGLCRCPAIQPENVHGHHDDLPHVSRPTLYTKKSSQLRTIEFAVGGRSTEFSRISAEWQTKSCQESVEIRRNCPEGYLFWNITL